MRKRTETKAIRIKRDRGALAEAGSFRLVGEIDLGKLYASLHKRFKKLPKKRQKEMADKFAPLIKLMNELVAELSYS